MVFYSCEKEIIEDKKDIEHQQHNNIYPSNQRTFIEGKNRPLWPDLDLYKNVLNKLYSDDLFQANYSNLVHSYGYPMLNFATINTTTPYEYVLTIPLVKDGDISSFIFYFANGTYGHFAFAPTSLGFELLNKDVSEQFDPVAFLTLIKYNDYQINRYSRFYPHINSWLMDHWEYNNNFQSSSERNVEITIEYQTGEFNLETLEVNVIWVSYQQIIPCGDSGGGGTSNFSPDFPPGEGANPDNPGGSTGSSPDTPPGDDPIDIVSPVDPTDINPDCATYIFNEDALRKLKEIAEYTIYSCDTDMTTEEIIENILDKLCEGIEGIPTLAGGGFEISHIEWPELTLTEEDISNAFLEEDYVLTNRLKDCPKAKCLIDFLIGGESDLKTDYLCTLLQGFMGIDRHLHILEGDFTESERHYNNAYAVTGISSEHAEIVILFNTQNCENLSTFELYETFFHELIHANIRLILIEEFGLEGEENFEDTFRKYLERENWDPNEWNDEHKYMLERYIGLMVENLYIANG